MGILKKYVWIVPLIAYLGLSSYVEGARPVFQYQLQNVACSTIVVGYINAVRSGDEPMIEYWKREAATYQCKLPPI